MPITAGDRKQIKRQKVHRKRGYCIEFVAENGEVSVIANPDNWAAALDSFHRTVRESKRDQLTGAQVQLCIDGNIFMNEVIPHP
jgi:hypothetical protein